MRCGCPSLLVGRLYGHISFAMLFTVHAILTIFSSYSKGREGVLEATIPVYPGTHHIKFLVDGRMETSMHLPTTVDFGNNLVNYIEVSGDDTKARNLTLDVTPPKSATEAEALPSRQPSKSELETGVKQPQTKAIDPVDKFSGAIPQYLADFDQPEDSRAYQLSVAALDKLPTPPVLPGFLSKPIMNANALIKDDNSVLNMPNHTVLNHLATSSIKNNVLAVSATTRYRNKVSELEQEWSDRCRVRINKYYSTSLPLFTSRHQMIARHFPG